MGRTAKRRQLIVMIAVSIAILLSAFGLSVTANGPTDGTTFKVIANITVGSSPAGVAYDPSNGYIYVTNAGSGTVSIISTSVSASSTSISSVTTPTTSSTSTSSTLTSTKPTLGAVPTWVVVAAVVVIVVVLVVALLMIKRRKP